MELIVSLKIKPAGATEEFPLLVYAWKLLKVFWWVTKAPAITLPSQHSFLQSEQNQKGDKSKTKLKKERSVSFYFISFFRCCYIVRYDALFHFFNGL